MRSRETPMSVVPKLDVSVAGVYFPRGKAVPLIAQLENARELRRSGLLIESPLPPQEQAPRSAA